mmetsp:Transcript_14923/g.13114  ORF Transcript_14923/g.13114 Transcript_14923/m.13114 type:complete len:93 (+) Transcript_14923:371-649(+)
MHMNHAHYTVNNLAHPGQNQLYMPAADVRQVYPCTSPRDNNIIQRLVYDPSYGVTYEQNYGESLPPISQNQDSYLLTDPNRVDTTMSPFDAS